MARLLLQSMVATPIPLTITRRRSSSAHGSDTLTELFTYTMEDTNGAASTATVTITIQGANDAPVAIAMPTVPLKLVAWPMASAGINPSGNVLSNDTDVDSVANGETKTVTACCRYSIVSGWRCRFVGYRHLWLYHDRLQRQLHLHRG